MASKPKKLKFKTRLQRDVSHRQPDFLKGYLRDYEHTVVDGPFVPRTTEEPARTTVPPLQQIDLLKPFYMDIMKHGLKYVADKYPEKPSKVVPVKVDSNKDVIDADVIIVGAGMAGLAAAYELERANVSVLLLEQTNRVGGRVYTFGEKDGLAKGLYGEAGAMRLPCDKDTPVDEMIHFMTDFYIEKFKLPKAKFENYDGNAYYSFYGTEKKRAKDWIHDGEFNKLWPGWSANIHGKYRRKITTIDEYYNHTTDVVTNQLRKWLKESKTPEEQADTWHRWIDIWYQFTLEGFLQSSYDAVIAKIMGPKDQEGLDVQEGLEDLKNLLPWPDIAVRGYSVFSYTEQLDQSLVQYLRFQLGQWWSKHHMHCIDGGMSKLPEAFASAQPEDLQSKIQKNQTVNVITYTYNPNNPDEHRVKIDGYHTDNKIPFPTVTGRAVIVTTAINILRMITFKSQDNEYPPEKEFYQAIEDIFTGASTKIFLQTKTRFWENGANPIMGGFSKTNLPVGQIHYCRHDGTTNKGLLMVYTWKSEALMFGSVNKESALREAIEQVFTIHPEIKDQYESGIVHAWYNQPNTQGAYGVLKPMQFQNVRTLWHPMYNVFFAGEGLSTASGWIQGALESGLKSAYECYNKYESVIPKTNS